MTETFIPGENDRRASLLVRLDLKPRRSVLGRNRAPSRGYSQPIVRLADKEGGVEVLDFLITIPEALPKDDRERSLRQANAVDQFFGQSVETMYQANIMLTARDYALRLTSGCRWPTKNQHVIWLGMAAYILSKPKMRHSIRNWTQSGRHDLDAHDPVQKMSHRRCLEFGEKLVRDLRANGSQVFA